ncbi:CPBP family intramembrane metalloprotease [Anaerocolumna sp. AGMB13025]|uniref:CPBP family intramembrane glutamic endopeptidase n=1 Tax=Anaerocolumna sp. AGMB13025 TaxID=3039116 RepID=UPI00241F5172|nr:CPBP family intramembrane glutamic endopeptidase [Anaerocolumna sp. AGMB13025]WFR56561.1 CPBP family intramembrane metalloprotease [Anaerocolumna sp. AGMB13025]
MKKSFVQNHSYIAAILIGLLCVFMSALGMAVPQIIGLGDRDTYLVATIFLIISVIVGLFIMNKSRSSLAEYGFRKNRKGTFQKVCFYIPLLIMELIPIVVFGFSADIAKIDYIIIALFTIAVGFNEEIYFRGLTLKFLEGKGKKKAIIYSSVIFGILHLANVFNGRNTLYLVLQVLFAFLVGIVLAELVSLTKSLWLVIIWHAAHDYISYITKDDLDKQSLIVLAIQVGILLIYAVYLWSLSMREE